MYRDDWMQAAAFVLLAAIGCYTGYRATLPTREFMVLNGTVSVASAPAPAAPLPASNSPAAVALQAPLPTADADHAASEAATSNEPSAPPATAAAELTNPAAEPAPAPTEVAALTPPAASTATAPAAAATDPVEALKAAANAGDSHAQYALGIAYKLGRGVATDTGQSLLWMRRAATGGLPAAARTLGIAYEEGNGIDKDTAEAAKWYTRAALGGDLQGMHNLAYFFTQGVGGMSRDGTQAEHWFRMAAERGLVASQINLAILCSQGAQWGIETRLSDSYFWSGVAALRGDPQATRMHAVFAKVFAPAEKAKLDAKIAAFKPKPIDAVANGGFDTSPDAFLPPPARPGLTDAEIATARQMLAGLGYGSPNDPQPEQAIKAFQGAYGLDETGKADRQLLAALKSVPH